MVEKYDTMQELQKAIDRGEVEVKKRYPKGYETNDYFNLDIAGKYVFEKFGKKFNTKLKDYIVKLARQGKIRTVSFMAEKSIKLYKKTDIDKYLS